MATRGPKLSTTREVARFLAKITREAYGDRMEMTKAKGLAYIASQLMKALETSDLESRLEALELGGVNTFHRK